MYIIRYVYRLIYIKSLLKRRTHLKISMIVEVLPSAAEKKISICTTV